MASVGDTDLCLQGDPQDSTSLLVAEDGADGAINGAEVIGFLAVGSNVGNGLQISDEGGAVDWDVLFPTAGLFQDVEAGSSGDKRRKVEGHCQPSRMVSNPRSRPSSKRRTMRCCRTNWISIRVYYKI